MARKVLLSIGDALAALQDLYPEKDTPAMIRWLKMAGAVSSVCLADEMIDMTKVEALLGTDPSKIPVEGDIIQSFSNGTYLVTEAPIHRDDIVFGIKVVVGQGGKYNIIDITVHPITIADSYFVKQATFPIKDIQAKLRELQPLLHEIEKMYDTIISMTEKEDE